MSNIHEVAYITNRCYNNRLHAYEYECNIGTALSVWYPTSKIAHSDRLTDWFCVLDYERQYGDLNDEYTKYILHGGQGNNLPGVHSSDTPPAAVAATVKPEPSRAATIYAVPSTTTHRPAHNGHGNSHAPPQQQNNNTSNAQSAAQQNNHRSSAPPPASLPAIPNTEPPIVVKREPSLPRLEPASPTQTAQVQPYDGTPQPDVTVLHTNIHKRFKPITTVKSESDIAAQAVTQHATVHSPPKLKPVARPQPLNSSFDIVQSHNTPDSAAAQPAVSTPLKMLLDLHFFRLETDVHGRQCYRCKCNVSFLATLHTDRLIEHLQNYHIADYNLYCDTRAMQQSYLRQLNGKTAPQQRTKPVMKPFRRAKPVTAAKPVDGATKPQPAPVSISKPVTHKPVALAQPPASAASPTHAVAHLNGATSTSSISQVHNVPHTTASTDHTNDAPSHTSHSRADNTHRFASLALDTDRPHIPPLPRDNRSASPVSSTASVSPMPSLPDTSIDYSQPPNSLLFEWGYFAVDVADDGSVEWICQAEPRCFGGSRISFKPHNGLQPLVDHLQNHHLHDGYALYIASDEGQHLLSSKVGKRNRGRR